MYRIHITDYAGKDRDTYDACKYDMDIIIDNVFSRITELLNDPKVISFETG